MPGRQFKWTWLRQQEHASVHEWDCIFLLHILHPAILKTWFYRWFDSHED